MADFLPRYISDLSSAFASSSSARLLPLVPLEAGHPAYPLLQGALASVPPSSLTSSAAAPYTSAIPAPTRETFTNFLLALLRYIRLRDGPDFEVVHAKFKALVEVYTEANRLYGQTNDGAHLHPFLNHIILGLAKALFRLSRSVASLSPHPPRDPRSPRSIRDITRQIIEKSMQVSSASYGENDADPGVEMVGDAAWGLANILWRIYAERKLHTQSTELLKTFNALSPPEEKRLVSRANWIRNTDVCESYYWRGKLGVTLLDMRNAKYWLDKSWRFCAESAWKQRRSILIRLIPVNLLLGHLPSQQLLQHYDIPQFVPLIQAFKTGNMPRWRRELDENREWYRRRGVWLILFERGEILVWRNLLRQSLKLYYDLNQSAPRNRCPTSLFITAAQHVFDGSGEVEDGTITLEDIIIVIASLVDQGLILGHLSYSQLQLVMKPSPDGMGGFPKVSTVVPRRIEAIQ